MNVLNVAEKPSVAKSVSTILSQGSMRVREGRSRYNKIFEFNYTIRGQPCHMLFTSVTGHLMELAFEDRYRKWHSCDPADLFNAPVHKSVPEDKKDIKRTLEEEARKCQWLVLWLDCDREGENIAFEVVDVCSAVNRRLSIKRARFSALIPRDIHQAVQNLVEPNKWFADAVDARQEIDLRIGASFTRFQTLLMKDAFNIDTARNDRNLVISYGPCQFPTLGFVVERYWERQAHEPEEYWLINCTHESDEGVAKFKWMRGHFFDYTCAVIIYEMCIEEPTATVRNVRQQEKLKYPPYPLNTLELAKRASWYFRMSAEHTMKVAEELYQSGFISYPRTETNNFSPNTDLKTIVQEQQSHPEWGIYAQRLLDPGLGLWRNPRDGKSDDKAHPPIHPTKFSIGESGWSQDHRKLYEFVVRHFLACVSKPAVGAETTVEIDIAGELFSSSGRVVLEKNYLDVYRYESWGGSMIPTYNIGQQFIPTTLTLDSGVTQPPPLLSEADLLSCMDKEGIGTDATMHDHIKKLLDRSYATKDAETRFTPTNLGEALVMGYDDMGYKLWKPYLRAVMERDMKLVGEGNKTKAEVLETSLQQMKACFLDARLNKVKLLEAMAIFFERSSRSGSDELHATGAVVRRCGLCQESDMVLRKNRVGHGLKYGNSLFAYARRRLRTLTIPPYLSIARVLLDGNFMVGCLGFPQCRNVVWLPGSVLEAVVTTNTCNYCTPGPVYLIQFKFRQLEIPPNYSADHLGCIGGCDQILTQLTEICGRGPRMPARTGGPAASTSNAHHTNPRQGVCIICQETGHSSNDCPSRSTNVRHHGMSENNGEVSVSCSSCGTPCVLLTAHTAQNNGRKFYKCQTQECNFFLWQDSLNDGTGGSSVAHSNSGRGSCRRVGQNESRGRGSRNGSRGRGGRNGSRGASTAFVSATGDPISGRCYVCGDPNHFANVCPNRGV